MEYFYAMLTVAIQRTFCEVLSYDMRFSFQILAKADTKILQYNTYKNYSKTDRETHWGTKFY
jgi:hypothetical protein